MPFILPNTATVSPKANASVLSQAVVWKLLLKIGKNFNISSLPFHGPIHGIALSPSFCQTMSSAMSDIALSIEGERLLASTQSLFETVEVALSELSDSANSPTGELRLTAPSILIKSQLTDTLAVFSMNYPGIKLAIDYSDMRKDVISGGFDLAVRMEVQPKKSANARSLFLVERQLIASTDYLKNRPKVRTPDDVASWDWIELTPVRHVKPLFRKSKTKQITFKPESHISANDALAVYHLAQAGAGLAVVPAFLAEEGISSGTVQNILPEWKLDPISVFATWPSNAPKNGLINLLIDTISPNQSLR